MDTAAKAHEASLRREARRLGFRLERDRARVRALAHLGGYRLVDARGRVVAGRSFELSLADAAEFLDGERGRLAERAGKAEVP